MRSPLYHHLHSYVTSNFSFLPR